MTKICIMTWNTSLYVEKTISPICRKYKSIVNVVKGQLEKENSIAFLQEIPYCSNETWEEHTLYCALKKDFPADEYDIKFTVSSKKQIMMTIAIAKKNTIESNNTAYNDNRTISVKFKELELMGIHAKNGNQNKDYLKSLNNSNAHIILGDFNAGDYKKSENKDVFNGILKGHTNICNQCTTVFDTSIDHVFVHNDIVSKCSNLIVHKEIKCSDHFPITFEINI